MAENTLDQTECRAPSALKPDETRADALQAGTLGVFASDTAMRLLFGTARRLLAEDELRWFADHAAEHAGYVSRHAADLADGLGCLICGDVAEAGHLPAGTFQSTHDVPQVLFHFGEVFRQVAGLVYVAEEAAFELSQRGAK